MASIVLNAAVTAMGIANPWVAIAAHIAASYVGSAIDQKLFGTTQHGYGPTLQMQNLQASTLGQMIPIVKGRARLSGNMIWSSAFLQTANTQSAGGGGKGGGGGATMTNYTYSQSLAVAVCKANVGGIRRIWASGRLIYDAGTDSVTDIIAHNNNQTAFTVYNGDEAQTPNSFIQAAMTTSQSMYYFLCAAMAQSSMQVTVGAGVLTVGTGTVRVASQVVTMPAFAVYAPVVAGRIDRIVVNATTGVASVLTGTVANPPHAPTIPAGHIPVARVRFDQLANPALPPYITTTAQVTGPQITPEGASSWRASTAYGYDPISNAGSFVYSNGFLYQCATSGTSGATAPTGTSTVSDGTCNWLYVSTAQAPPPVPTPAYRGTMYVVFYNFQLATTGNTTPNFEFEVHEPTTDLADVVSSFAGMAGITADKLDVTQLIGTTTYGLSVNNQSSCRAVLQPLAAAFFFDAVEIDAKIRFVKRGGNLTATIQEDDTAARNNGSALTDNVTLTRKQELDLPRTISVQFPNVNNSFLVGSRYHRMQNTNSVLATVVQMPIAMTENDAQGIATKLTNIAWNERTAFSFSVSKKFCMLEPTDIVAVVKGGSVYEVRLISKDESKPGIVTFGAVMEDVGLYSARLNNVVSSVVAPQLFNATPGSINAPLIFDGPGVISVSDFSIWIGAGSSAPTWGGCGVFVSTDNLNFHQVGTMHRSSTYGTCTLPAGSAIDVTNTAVVTTGVIGTDLPPYAPTDADNLLSLCYVGGELIAYDASVAVAGNVFDLGASSSSPTGRLLRGKYNTPITSHVNAPFARLDSAMFQYAYSATMIGQTLYFKFPSFNTHGAASEDIASVPTYTHTISGAMVPVNAVHNTVPAAPTATASGALMAIHLAWTFGDTRRDISSTQVWWSASNDAATAQLIAQVPFPQTSYDHLALQPGQTCFYWFYVVDVMGNISARYPTASNAGVVATTSTNPSALLAMLNNSLTLSQMNGALAASLAQASSLGTAQAYIDQQTAIYLAAGNVLAQATNLSIADGVSQVNATLNGVDLSFASQVNAVQARLNTGDVALALQAASATASAVNGINATQVIKVQANGTYAGMNMSASTTAGSAVVFSADMFQITIPNALNTNAAIPVFTARMLNGVNTVGIDGALIVSKSITADSLNITNGISSLTSNIGTMTSGALQSVDGKFVIDLTNKFISITT